ncbi:hypothetical protein F2P81_017714 [Scophthalmus maximus]|uniref:Collagen IV NC1 domain-containing protein n=2 Tax=Scophthalmus maximus TaxID=52904 RepID=A0A6A4S9R0_SCOMX|nr:hypothetical protein F2P81_017714 [Scophthalmus maximus]
MKKNVRQEIEAVCSETVQEDKQGEPGYLGEHGLPGVIGYPGNEGHQGPPGEKGLPGKPGFPGPPGLPVRTSLRYSENIDKTFTEHSQNMGDVGYQGLPGVPGPVGFRGRPGMRGTKGNSFVFPVPPDIKGLTGQQGLEGQKLTHKGFYFRIIGGSVLSRDLVPASSGPDGIVFVSQGQEGPSPVIPGPRGQTGDPGKHGVKGEQGERGDPGSLGKQGKDGLIGELGLPGDPGDRGYLGPPGIEGSKVVQNHIFLKGQLGVPGPHGPPGPAGEPGIIGFPGLQGESGVAPTGPPGPHGSPGLTGPKGEPGETGPLIIGPPGDTGVPGGPGAEGEPGEPGIPDLLPGDVGFPGAKGTKGLMGLTGTRGEDGQTGEKGEVCFVCPVVSSDPGSPGRPGEPGEAGMTGSDGFPGTKGDKGVKGVRGPLGPQVLQVLKATWESLDSEGFLENQVKKVLQVRSRLLQEIQDRKERKVYLEIQDPKGDRGIGFPGQQGQSGPQGEDGSVGPQGDPGPQGEDGVPGSPGPDGPPGPNGRNALDGVSGPNGFLGVCLEGPPGPEGGEGQMGIIGFTGLPGDPGRAGQTGPLGPNGLPGNPGEMGKPGFKGEKGSTGPCGEPGSDGKPGSGGPKGIKGELSPPGPGFKGCPGEKVHLDLLEKRVVTVLRGKLDLQDPAVSQVTKGLLEILVLPVPEEARDKMGYLDLQERKEPWEALLGRRALLDPVALLVPVVLEENQGVLVLLDSLVLLAVLARREFALQEEKEKTVSLEHKEQKVLLDVRVLLALQVLVIKERREVKQQQVTQDHRVTLATLVLEASRDTPEKDGFLFTRHSQNLFVPSCPAGSNEVYSGYSLLFINGNNRAHGQDLGTLGSCLPLFTTMPFLFCNTDSTCRYASRNDYSYWLSTNETLPASVPCTVCEARANVIAIHSQTSYVPDCPSGWDRLWLGFSFVMETGVGAEGSGQPLASPGSCLEYFRKIPFIECHGRGTCNYYTDSYSYWLAALNPNDMFRDVCSPCCSSPDDTTVTGLISDGDESAYRREINSWSNNLELNTLKTVEMTVDSSPYSTALSAVDSFSRRLSIKHTARHVTCGGGDSGFKTAAPRGPGTRDQPRTRTQHQDQQKEPDQQTVGMQSPRCPAIFILVLMVLCSPVSSQDDRNQDQDQDQYQDLDLELRHHRLLQRARSADLLTQEWSKRAVADLLAQMSLPEADAQRDAEMVSTATGGKMNLERSIEPPNNLPPRERKAGCKSFYWKGYTSCDDDEDGDEGIVGEHHVLVQLLPPRRFWNLPVERVCFRVVKQRQLHVGGVVRIA